jgi:hypothetical protein
MRNLKYQLQNAVSGMRNRRLQLPNAADSMENRHGQKQKKGHDKKNLNHALPFCYPGYHPSHDFFVLSTLPLYVNICVCACACAQWLFLGKGMQVELSGVRRFSRVDLELLCETLSFWLSHGARRIRTA